MKNLDVDRARDAELERALRLLRRGENPARILDELSRRLMNKLIHAPTRALREAAKLRTLGGNVVLVPRARRPAAQTNDRSWDHRFIHHTNIG